MDNNYWKELANRMKGVLLLFALTFLLGFYLAPAALQWFSNDIGVQLFAQSPLDAFTPAAYVALAAAIAVSLPFVLWQFAGFLSPAMTKQEKSLVLGYLMPSTMLFALGTIFGYYFLVKIGFAWLSAYGHSLGITMIWNASQTLALAFWLVLLTGLSFQLPIFLLGLDSLGIFDIQSLSAHRRQAWFSLAVFAAVITPTWDLLTMGLFWLPLVVLFEATLKYHELTRVGVKCLDSALPKSSSF